MRILLDCEELKNPYTGLHTFTIELAQSMAKVIEIEDKLSFLVPKECDNTFGEKYKYVRRSFSRRTLPFIFVPQIDVWHTTFQLSRHTGGSFTTNHVLTVHDLNFLYEDLPSRLRKELLKTTSRNINRADHIVAISEFVKEDILNHIDVKGKPVSVVYNGYRVLEYPEYDKPIYAPQKAFIFTMGMVNAKKNFKVLPCLLKNNDYELIIAGKLVEPCEFDYKRKIEDEARKYGVEDRIRFLGSIPEQDKYWYLKNCTAFVFPSIAEGFGLPVIEAMHFGKPVFISKLTSLPEIGGTAAYYFDSFDPDHMNDVFQKSMDDYLNNPTRREEIRLHSTKFSYDKAAREYYEIYKSLLK